MISEIEEWRKQITLMGKRIAELDGALSCRTQEVEALKRLVSDLDEQLRSKEQRMAKPELPENGVEISQLRTDNALLRKRIIADPKSQLAEARKQAFEEAALAVAIEEALRRERDKQ